MRRKGAGAVARSSGQTDETRPSSRLPGFHKLTLQQRLEHIARAHGLSPEEIATLRSPGPLPLETANSMIENAVGTFSLPLGLGLNLQVNRRDYLVPMAVEEPGSSEF